MNTHEVDLEVILEVAKECLALKPDGFDGNPDAYDKAIMGLTDNGQLVYSKDIMIRILADIGEMDIDDAIEFLEYNCFCAYVGDQTPVFVNTYM